MSLFGERTGLPTWFNGGKKKKKMPANAGDPGSISESGRSPGEANGNPLQCSCLENPMDREAWWAIVHGVAESWTQQHKHKILFEMGPSPLFSGLL